MSDEYVLKSAGLWEKDFSSGIEGYNLAGVLLFGKDEVISKRARENFNIGGFSQRAIGLTGVQKLKEMNKTTEIKD